MSEDDTSAVRIHTLERLINVLQSSDKSAKKKAFLEIKSTVESSSGTELQNLYDKLSHTLRIAFQDPAEHCREQAIKLTYDFINRLDKNIHYLTSLMPVIHCRICVQNNDREPSEEVRLLHVKLVALLIDKYEGDVTPYTKDLVEILSILIADEAPHVKKDSCACLIKLANTAKYAFFEHSEICIKPLIGNLNHQHWRVRVAAIEALEWAMLRGDHKAIPVTLNPLSRKLLDDTPFVRLAIVKLAGHWMLDLQDRYSFFPILIAIVLSSFTDGTDEVVQEGKALWLKAGAQYLKENEKDYKDTINYVPESLEHYPPGVERPGLGCRMLVSRECSKFIPAIALELTDWVAAIRIKAAQLLTQVTLHTEKNITMEINKIIGAMIKAAMDEELPAVISSVRLAAYYMGFFIEPSVYCDLIVDHMKECNPGERRILASLISGSQREPLREQLPKVAPLISSYSFKGRDQEALLEIISSIFYVCKEDSFDIGNCIFLALVSVIGLAEHPKIAEKAYKLLEEFANFGGGDKKVTYCKYSEELIITLMKANWASKCYEQYIFYALTTHAGEAIPANLTRICEIIKVALSEKSDPEPKLKVYLAVNEIIKDHKTTLPTNECKEKFSQFMLCDILPQQLKWYPGKSAEALRTIASTSLYMLLTTFGLELKLPKDMYPLLQSLLEDAAEKTRILALLSITHACNYDDLQEDLTFENNVQNVLKRLDDCAKRVRELSLNCVLKLYEARHIQKTNWYLNVGLLEFTYKTLLIHIDDEEKDFRQKVFDVLNVIGKLEPSKLWEIIQVDNFRDKELIRRLLALTEDKLKQLAIEENNEKNRTSESCTSSNNLENNCLDRNEIENKNNVGMNSTAEDFLVIKTSGKCSKLNSNKLDETDHKVQEDDNIGKNIKEESGNALEGENPVKSVELITSDKLGTTLEPICQDDNKMNLNEIGKGDSLENK